MQRRFPQQTAMAAVGGATGGTTIGLSVADDSLGHDMGVVLLPIACVTIVAMHTFRRWLKTHDEQTRRAYDELAQRRLRLDEEHANRLRQLTKREAEFARESATRRTHVAGMARHLGEILIALGKERHARATLQEEYDELADDFNQLVQETMQDRTDRFARTPAETRSVPRLIKCSTIKVPERRRGEPTPAVDGARDHV